MGKNRNGITVIWYTEERNQSRERKREKENKNTGSRIHTERKEAKFVPNVFFFFFF